MRRRVFEREIGGELAVHCAWEVDTALLLALQAHFWHMEISYWSEPGR